MYVIKCGNLDITQYITSCTSSIEFEESTPLVGNASSVQFNISIDNTSRVMDNIINNKFYIYKDDELLHTLQVTDMPEIVFQTLELKLYDNLIITNVNYDTNTKMYPCKVVDQLEEMKALIGVDIDYSNLPNEVLKRTVNEYDNREWIRIYLCQIAEAGCCNIFCKPNGVICFYPVGKEVVHNIENDSYVYSFKKSNRYTVSMVICELLNLYKGDESGNVLKTTENNPYITSQEHIDLIFDRIGGITLDSIENLSTRSIQGLKLGEIVKYKNYFTFIPRKIQQTYYNGKKTHDVISIDGKLNYSGKSSYLGNNDLSSKVKRVKLIVDELDGSFKAISQQIDEVENLVGQFSVGFDEIKGEVSKVVDTIYKFETGSNNIFEKCNQTLVKTKDETDIKRKSDMPLGINKDYMQGKDVVISADINVKNAKFSDLGNFIGAEFDVRYKDGTTKTYFTKWYLGQFLFQYLLQTDTSSHFERIWMHYKIDDKEIDSVSNLRMIIALNAEQATISYPKVEFGTQPTGFEFDMNYIRDNIETIQKDYTLIEQKIDTLTLKAVSTEEQITTIQGDVSSVTTRIQSAEIKLQPTNILLAVNEKIGADGKLYTTKFILDKLGVHISGGGIDISNNSGAKVLYADTEGNLTIANLTAVNGKFTGTITGSTINGSTINTDKDLYVGNRIFLGNQNDSQEKFIYLKNSYVMKLSSGGDIYIQNPYTRLGLLNQTHGLASGFSVESKYAIGLYSGLAPGATGVVGASITITGQSNTSSKNTIHIDAQSHIYASRSIEIGSDVRLKENFSDINLKNIFNYINVKSFNYIHSSKRTVGVIAQDFVGTPYEDIIVSKNKDGYYSVDYNVFTMALIQEVMYLREQIRNMQIDFARIGGLYSALNN